MDLCTVCLRSTDYAVDSNHKPFSCPECSKGFGRQDVLARHRKLHQHSPAPAMNGPLMPTTTRDRHGSEVEIGINGFSPAASSGSSILPGEPFLRHEDHFQPAGNMPMPLWADSEDMLDFLTSDFSINWPVPAPVTQFQPSNFDRVEGSILSPPEDHSQTQHGQAHQAMQQMSKLISVLSSNLTAEIQNTGITSSFLDTCMYVFFDKFIPSFPVLHKGESFVF